MSFSFFLKSSFFGLLGGLKGKQLPKMKNNNYIHHVPFLKNSIAYNQGKKWPKMTKKICLLQLTFQEPYIIWLLFMVHLCKMMISLGLFFLFFHYFDSLGFYGARGKGKKWSKMRKKVCLSHSVWFWFLVLMSKMIISPGVYVIFLKFWFSGLLGR